MTPIQRPRHNSGPFAHPIPVSVRKRRKFMRDLHTVLIWFAIIGISVLVIIAFAQPAWAVEWFGAGPGMMGY